MVRGRDLRATNIYKQVRSNLSTPIFEGRRQVAPPWLKAMENIPPSEILTRPIPVQHHAPNPRARKPRNIFKPQRIVYEEDELRRNFYKDHPWELARPRTILEVDGKDSWHCDWSRGLRQPGVPLTGESVVQRQLWVMHNEDLSKEQAYDKVRREFYAERQEEDIQRRIAREEAMMVGAYFGKNRLQIGQELEDNTFEQWKRWAQKLIEVQANERANAYTSFGSAEAEEEVDGLDPNLSGDASEKSAEAVPLT